MDFHSVLDSIIDHFDNHHKEQVLTLQGMDDFASQNPEWLHDTKLFNAPIIPDHMGSPEMLGGGGRNFSDDDFDTSLRSGGVRDIPQETILTQDKMPLASPSKPVYLTDTPYRDGQYWKSNK